MLGSCLLTNNTAGGVQTMLEETPQLPVGKRSAVWEGVWDMCDQPSALAGNSTTALLVYVATESTSQ